MVFVSFTKGMHEVFQYLKIESPDLHRAGLHPTESYRTKGSLPGRRGTLEAKGKGIGG